MYGVERFPENEARESTVWSSGIFQAETPFVLHWKNTSSTCVWSTQPARSTFPSDAIWASAPRIGPDVSTGEQMRIRRRARPQAFAIRWASASP